MAKKNSSPRGIGKGGFWNPRFQTNCREIYVGMYIFSQNQKGFGCISAAVLLNLYSNSVSNKVESRRDETLLRTELRTNSATVNNEEYFLRNFG